MAARKSGASGSEKRQRPYVVTVRVNGAERTELTQRADRAGFSVPAYIRHQALDVAPPRQRPRPNVETVLLARLLGQIGQMGSDVQFIGEKVRGSGGLSERDLQALDLLERALNRWGDELLRAMGRASEPGPELADDY